MNIYLLTQDQVKRPNTFNSLVVIAKDRLSASRIHPDTVKGWSSDLWAAAPIDVNVKAIGNAVCHVVNGVVQDQEESIVLVNLNR